MMAAVKSKNTSPEINIRRTLFAKGFRYRLHDKKLPGSPDLIFPKYRAVLFIHGCFWHQHDCPAGKLPATNPSFWHTKLRGNARRDRENIQKLLAAGWRVKVIWTCSLKNKKSFYSDREAEEIAIWLRSSS